MKNRWDSTLFKLKTLDLSALLSVLNILYKARMTLSAYDHMKDVLQQLCDIQVPR